MLHILIGIGAIVLGLWSIARNWFTFVDLFLAILPLILIAGGIISLLAGVRGRVSKK